jgi:hypothetical protein
MAETTGSLSRREMRERGKGVKTTPVDTEMEALGLSSVPGFERPLGAGPKDRFIGEDEAGNKIYKNDASGVVYTIKPNPDQRTLNTKAKDWWASWNQRGRPLLSREQVIEIAKQIPQDAYESVASAVRGEGTLGDVVGLAPNMGVGSLFFEVPEGALRIFGGRKATNPNIDSNGNLLPQSQGKDGEPRFEIVDKDAKFNLYDMSFIDTKKEITSISDFGYSDSLPSWSRPYKFLNEVFEHDELYRQYPSIGDIRVVIDNSLSGTRTRGYFSEEFNLIALNPSLKPEEAMSTLLHEIQHKVQKIEGFSLGTSIQSKELVPIAETIYALKQNEKVLKKAEAYEEYNKKLAAYEEAKKKYEIDLKTFEDFDYRDLAHVQLGFLTDMAEELGLPFDEFFSRSVDSVSILEKPDLWRLLNDRDELLSFIDRPEPQKQNDFIFRSASFLSSYKDLPGFEQSGKNWFGEEGWQKVKDEKSFALGLMPEKPYLILAKPTEPFFIDTDLGVPSLVDYDEAYRRKAGETEARNVTTRKDMTLEERFANPPESTEDKPRDLQWTEFAKGGEVKKDPVSGNKVPPNGTAKGVRDDVPALLSEGEYVIPENVVNTYGAKTFDRLVQQTNDMLKTQPGKVQKMAEGGFVTNPTEADIVSGFNPDAYRTVGFSYFGGTAPTTQVSYTYVTYINANGDTIQIRVDANGNPLDPIPAGYMTMEAYQAQLQNTREEGNTTEEQQDDFTSYYTYDEEQFKQMLEDPSGLEKTMLDLFGGGVFGGLIEQDRITNLEAAAVVANDLGYTDVAQELLDKSKTLASEAGKPSKLTEWLSADAANVVDRHRKAAPEGLLGTLSLTPVEPGKPISLDGRTPPPEAFTSTGVPATTTPVPVINPGQYPLSTDVVQPPPTAQPGTGIAVNNPAYEGATFKPTPSQPPIETTTLPTAPTTQAYYGNDPRLNVPTGGMPAAPQPTEQLFPASVNPSAAAVEAAQARAVAMMQGQPTVPTTAPTQSVAPIGTADTANRPTQQGLGFTQPQPAPLQQVPTAGTLPQVGQAPTPPVPVVSPTVTTAGPTQPVAPTAGITPTSPTIQQSLLNTVTGGSTLQPQEFPGGPQVNTVAPTQPQTPGVVPQYIPGIDQGVATNPVMPGELFATPTLQAPTVGVAPVVNTQPPAGGRSSVSVPVNPPAGPPTTSSEVLTARIPPNLMAAPDADYRAPTLPTPTPTSEDSAPPSGEPPIPPGTTTAEKIGPGSVVPVMQLSGENPLPGDWIPEGSKINAATEQSPVSVSDGISVRRADPGSTAAVVMFEGEQYVIPKGETVLVAGQTVSYAGGETVNINGLNGGVTDVFPRDAFGKQFGTSNFVPPVFPREAYSGKESPLAPTTSPIPPARPSVEPTTSQKNTAPATKPPEVSWSSLTDLTPSNLNRGSLEQTIGFQTDPGNSANIEKIINYAESVGVDPAIALGLAQVESQFNPNATSKKAGHGLFQVTPLTALDPGYGVSPLEGTHGKETVDANIKFGIDYLKGMYEEFGNWEDALKAYNQGPGKTEQGELEPETRDYVPDVFRAADSWEQVLQNIEEETKKGFEDIEKVTGESDFADLRFDDESIFSDGDSTSSGGSSSNKTPTSVPTTTNLTTLSFGDTISTPTGGGNVAPTEDYDTGNQPFAKGGLVKRRPAKYSKGGLVKRRIMATRK